eukprot:m.118993 g.118993  ORF g.118993 m.118993 type:complete len:526 (+) comp14299_c0_seq2:236-1813(+)
MTHFTPQSGGIPLAIHHSLTHLTMWEKGLDFWLMSRGSHTPAANFVLKHASSLELFLNTIRARSNALFCSNENTNLMSIFSRLSVYIAAAFGVGIAVGASAALMLVTPNPPPVPFSNKKNNTITSNSNSSGNGSRTPRVLTPHRPSRGSGLATIPSHLAQPGRTGSGEESSSNCADSASDVGAVLVSVADADRMSLNSEMSQDEPIIFGEEAVQALLPMAACIKEMEHALEALATGTAVQPVRQVFKMPLKDTKKVGIMAGMPCFGTVNGKEMCCSKCITVFPGNKPPLSSHQGSVLLFDADNGRLLSITDAHELTAIRTAAASAAATRILSRGSASVLCILGTGVQALKHVTAICCVRDIKTVKIWGRNRANSDKVAAEVAAMGIPAIVCESVKQAVSDADIVCTLTGATEPILQYEWLQKGTHINAVGACQPGMRELDTDTVTQATLFVDTKEACWKEPGDIVTPLRQGVHIDLECEVGLVVAGQHVGRKNDKEITLFKSVGAAVEDLFASKQVYDNYCTSLS